jgi:hypothetical protein
MKNIRALIVIVSLGLFMVSFSGCCALCGCCPGQRISKTDNPAKKTMEMLAAKKQDPQSTRVGLVRSFKEEDGIKDFSFRYIPEEGTGCSAAGQGPHTHMTAGPNINFKNAGGDVYEDGSHKPGIGFQAGFQTVYRFNEKFSVVPGILFKQNTAKEEAEIIDGGEPPYNTSYKIEDKYTFNYLSVPLLAQYNLTPTLSVSAGPEINYLVNARVKSSVSMAGNDHSEKRNISDESVRLGLGVQAGLKYEIPDSRWALELMYDHRLSRLNKKHPEGYPNYTVPGWHMKSVQLSAKTRICDLVRGPKHQNVSSK